MKAFKWEHGSIGECEGMYREDEGKGKEVGRKDRIAGQSEVERDWCGSS